MRGRYSWYIIWLCLFPIGMMAEEHYVARLDLPDTSLYYKTFASALSKANKDKRDAVIQLLDDVGFDGKAAAQAVKTNLTIDLNGYSMGDTLTGTYLISLGIDSLYLHIFSSRPGGRIWCTRPYNGRINAVQCTKGRLSLDHVTIDATNTSDTLLKASACGVSAGKEAVLHMSDCAVRTSARINAYGVNTYTKATIERCVMDVHADSTNAYGVYVNQDTSLLVMPEAYVAHTVLRVKASQRAYGLLNAGSVHMTHDSIEAQTTLNDSYAYYSSKTNAQGNASQCVFLAEAGTIVCHAAYVYRGDLTAEDCSFGGISRMEGYEELTGSTTRGVSAGSNTSLVLRHCLINARGTNIPMTKGVTGVYGSATTQLVLYACDIRVEGNEATYGVNAGSRMEIDSCKVSVQAAGPTAYGINITIATDDTLQQDVTAWIRRTGVSLSAPQKSYGIYTRAPLVLDRDTIHAVSTAQDGTGSYALYAVSTCRIELTDCDLYAQSNEAARALYAAGSSSSISVVSCRRCRMSARGENKTYSVYMMSTGVLDSCWIDAYASGSDAYALYAATGCDTVTVNECHLRAEASEKALPVNANTKTEGLLWLNGGYYSTDTVIRNYMPEGYYVYRLHEGADYEEGYRYAIRPIDRPGVKVVQLYDYGTRALLREFDSPAEALRYVQFREGRFALVVTGSCRLAADHSGKTFYVPDYVHMAVACMDGQTDAIGEEAAHAQKANRKRHEYARMEVADSVRLVVEGMLEASALLQDEGTVTGAVSGEQGYGLIHLAPTASVSLTSGARMQAWGYVTGAGTVTARQGATVREAVVFGDWKGGTVSYEMLNNPQRVFPVTHFFYQNIECPVTYLPGSRALGSTYVTVGGFEIMYDDIRIIDHHAGALFVRDSVRSVLQKAYDPLTDRTEWTLSGDVTIEELSIATDNPLVSSLNLLSTHYVLPIGSGTTLRSQSGSLRIAHDAAMLPGAVLEIADSAELHIPEGVQLYLYDEAQWGRFSTKRIPVAPYSPSWKTCPRDTLPPSARMVVGGRVRIEGSMYTTEGGAEISGCDTTSGEVLFVHGASANTTVYQLTGTVTSHQYTAQRAVNAALRNADSTLTSTAKAVPGEKFIYTLGQWKTDRVQDTDTVPVDTVPFMALTVPAAHARGRLVWHRGGVYILTPEGKMYNLLGVPVKKEE